MRIRCRAVLGRSRRFERDPSLARVWWCGFILLVVTACRAVPESGSLGSISYRPVGGIQLGHYNDEHVVFGAEMETTDTTYEVAVFADWWRHSANRGLPGFPGENILVDLFIAGGERADRIGVSRAGNVPGSWDDVVRYSFRRKGATECLRNVKVSLGSRVLTFPSLSFGTDHDTYYLGSQWFEPVMGDGVRPVRRSSEGISLSPSVKLTPDRMTIHLEIGLPEEEAKKRGAPGDVGVDVVCIDGRQLPCTGQMPGLGIGWMGHYRLIAEFTFAYAMGSDEIKGVSVRYKDAEVEFPYWTSIK